MANHLYICSEIFGILCCFWQDLESIWNACFVFSSKIEEKENLETENQQIVTKE
jgi:hypothetical protein